MSKRVAKIKGTFLVPTVSKNNRLYTKENIGKAVARMKADLGTVPLTMATSHGAAYADDARSIIGRITSVDQLPDGSGTFEADIADTAAGRNIAALVTPENPYIKGISIRGQWMDDPITIEVDGNSCTTADDLSVVGIDFTNSPGVEGAEITAAEMAESAAAAGFILESVVAEADDFVDETPGQSQPTGSNWADPGYQKDKVKRYPLNKKSRVRSAWSYINMPKNAAKYSAAQLKRIKSRIKSAAKKFGIDINSESSELVNDLTEVLEAYASMCYDNGAACINVSGYTDDAGKLLPLGTRLAYAAMCVLNAVDPDEDGDVDLMMPDGTMASSSSSEAAGIFWGLLEGAGGMFGGDDMVPMTGDATDDSCMHCGGMLDDSAMYCPMCGQPVAQAEPSGKVDQPNDNDMEATVPTEDEIAEALAFKAAADEKAAADAKAAEEAAKAASSPEALQAMINEAVAKGVAAAVAAMAPTTVGEADAAAKEAADKAAAEAAAAAAATTTETFTAEQMQAKMDEAAAEARKKAIDEAVEAFRAGPGLRKGLVTDESRKAPSAAYNTLGLHEGAVEAAKALAEMGSQDFLNYSATVWETQPYKFAQGTEAERLARAASAS